MAYNRKNLLRRIIDIQEIYLLHRDDHTDKWILENKVQPIYHISRAAFYSYLKINAKKELKDIEMADKCQLNLF